MTERIVQQLRLRRQRRRIQVTGIGGVTEGPVARSFVNFDVLCASPYEGKTRETISGIEATVLLKITTTLPAYPVDFDPKWKHLRDLHLADPQ